MARHIDVENFEKDIIGKAKMLDGKTYFECDFIYETLWNQPTADVVEVKHGEWINHFDDLFPEESTQECSICHKEEFITLLNDNYCPNCGAKMDGGKR